MRYEMMFPSQLRRAVEENLPAVLPVGVLEYHAEHCVLGVDGVLVLKALEIIEKEMDIVILPTFYYGSASFVVEPPELKGTIHITPGTVGGFAENLFGNLLEVGFRNIHAFIHHQTENFRAGMPTDLALKLAARQSVFSFIEKERGRGWWGDDRMKDYYADQSSGRDPFNWIKIHPFMDEEAQKKFPIDHAGRQETSLMLAFCPEGVDRGKISGDRWYAESAGEADAGYGGRAKEMILESMRRILKEG